MLKQDDPEDLPPLPRTTPRQRRDGLVELAILTLITLAVAYGVLGDKKSPISYRSAVAVTHPDTGLKAWTAYSTSEDDPFPYAEVILVRPSWSLGTKEVAGGYFGEAFYLMWTAPDALRVCTDAGEPDISPAKDPMGLRFSAGPCEP